MGSMMKDFETPDDVYFKVTEAIRFIHEEGYEKSIVWRGAEIVAFSKETHKRRLIFIAPTKKKGRTPCYVFEKGWLFDAVVERFIHSEDEHKYNKALNYGRGFVYLLEIGYSWRRAVELNGKAYLFYATLYKEK